MTEKFEWFKGRYHSLSNWAFAFGHHVRPEGTLAWSWVSVYAGPDVMRMLTWALSIEVHGRVIQFWIDRNMDFAIGVGLRRYK